MGEGASTYVKVQKNKLLGKAPDEMRDFVFQSKRVNAFRKKDDTIPDEILEYLGEIKDPAENIILSISKAVRTVEMQKAYTQIRKLGQNKYIFKTESDAIEASNKLGFDENIFSRQIGKDTDSVTNTSLDSMWTTPELIRVLRKDEETFETLQKDGYLAATWRTYVGQKGFAQSMKTVYDHVTHMRNIVGGYQFGLANGRIFSHVNAPDQFKVLKSKVVDKAGKNIDSKRLKEKYERYLKLGIINTSVNVNQFREMLETGFQNKSPFRLLNKVAPEPVKSAVKTATDSNIYKYPKDLLVDKPTEIYMATDDYFKIGSFEAELATLREALPNASEEVLEQEAAMIVRNTLPNYDQVPKGIKQLRNLPLGNFVAFPAEMLRTSVHIVKQASKEIASNNAVIKERGLKRLAGFTATNLGWATAADMSATALGFSEQDREDLNLLGSGPFSTGRDTIYFTDGDGELRGLNTQYLNSYYSVTSSVREGYDKFRAGKLQGKEVEDYLMDSVQAGVKDFMAPYLSTSLATEPLLAISTALISDDGRDHTGRRLISDKSGIDMQRLAQIIGEPYIPGSITKGFKLSDALNEVPNKYNLEYQDPKYAKIGQTGFKSDSFSRKALIRGFEGTLKDYKYAENKNSIDRVRFSNVEKAEQDYIDVNDLRLQNQSDIYVAAQAAIRKIGSSTTNRLLIDSGISKEERAAIMTGKFEPEATDYIEKVLKAEATNVRKLKTIEERTEYRKKLKQARSDVLFLNKQMRRVKLDKASDFNPDEWLEFKEKIKQKRLSRVGGGEVSTKVPNAPSEPDERINKLTGIPYNEGAGAAYMDEDDPMRVLKMNQGGGVEEEREDYKSGGFLRMFEKLTGIDPKSNDDGDLVAFQTPVVVQEAERIRMNAGGVEEEREGYSAAGAILKGGMKLFSKTKAPVPTKAKVKETDSELSVIRPYEEVPTPATYDEMYRALKANKKEKINVEIAEGQEIGLRLDIPAYENKKNSAWVPTIHDEKGTKLTSHRATVALKNVDFSDIKKESMQNKSLKVKEGGPKGPFAKIGGNLVNRSDEENYKLAQEAINSGEWTQVGFNPKRHSYYFDRKTGEPVLKGDEAIQVGPLVLVKNAVFGNKKDFKYASGGKVLNTLRRARN